MSALYDVNSLSGKSEFHCEIMFQSMDSFLHSACGFDHRSKEELCRFVLRKQLLIIIFSCFWPVGEKFTLGGFSKSHLHHHPGVTASSNY